MDVTPVLVKDVNPNSNSSLSAFNVVNGNLFFTTNGSELWKSDGTESGTVLLKDVRLDRPGPSFLSFFTEANNTLFFAADDGVNRGVDLWQSDGTEAGTIVVKEFLSPDGTVRGFGDGPNFLTEFNNTLFFRLNDGISGNELWKSDGTEAGTVLVKDIRFGNDSSNPISFVEYNDSLFFSANDGINGDQLWKSDGTEAGTLRVTDLDQSGFSSPLISLTEANGSLFFLSGNELWKTDGTAEGTSFLFASSGFVPSFLTEFNNSLFFVADDGINGRELWKSDGTVEGTVLVKDINPNNSYGFPSSSSASNFTQANGSLFFSASDGINGTELWKTDGTAAGTVLVKDINPGDSSSAPRSLTEVNGSLFFSASDGVNGRELWKTDGTAAGTVLVQDINPGNSSSDPRAFTEVDGNLFFTANGSELWSLVPDSGNTAPIAVDDTVTTTEESIVTGNVLENNGNGADSDPDGDGLTVTQVNGSADNVGREIILKSGVTIRLNDDGIFEYDSTSRFDDLDAGQSATDSFTYTIDDGNGGTDTATVTVTLEGISDTDGGGPDGGDADGGAMGDGMAPFSFSGVKDKTIGDLTFDGQDIVFFNGSGFEMAFDGSDVLPRKAVISAFDMISDTEILLSFAKPTKLNGLGRVDGADVVKFMAHSPKDLGSTTTGQFELYVDGSDIGLNRKSERIDGLTQLSNGDLLFSTTGDAQLNGGVQAKGQDIVQFSPTSMGSDTSGSVSLFFDGSDVSLSNGSENVDAIALQGDQLLFSTSGNWAASNTQSGRREDVGQFTGTGFGVTTVGSFADELAFDGSQFGFNGDISGLDLGVGS